MEPCEALIDVSRHLLLGSSEGPRTRFASGDLVRLRRGFYVPTILWLEAKEHERFALAVAALAQAHPETVFCGETALFLRGLPTVKAPTAIEVAAASRGRLGVRPATFQVMGTSGLAERARRAAPPPVRRYFVPEACPEELGGFLAVPVASALAGVLATGRFARALTVADGVLRLQPGVPLLERLPFRTAVHDLPYATWRSRASLIASLARAGAESPGESVSRALMHLWGFPEPALQVNLHDALGLIGRTDFFWEPGLVERPGPGFGAGPVGEFDGWGKYFSHQPGSGDPAQAIRKEKRRENRLLTLGHRVVRWDWADLERPLRLRAKLVEAGLRPTGRRLVAERTA